ncbi:MAG TPA: sigma-70 family RNA polymerase sigma factor [Pyrinomonadaceae bacterium]
MPPAAEITRLLASWREGDEAALERLLPLIEAELHRIAHRYMRRESPGHTLQTTALVNEAFLKLADQNRIHWQNRAQFFGVAAKIMRRILINHARDQNRLKRGGGAVHVSLTGLEFMPGEESVELLALDAALLSLERVLPRKCRVVELRFFGGLTFEETAEVLNVSPATVRRDWEVAKAWLLRELSNGE